MREMRLGHFLHGGWGFDSVIERGAWLSAIVANGRFANGAPGPGALSVGAPADILVLDLDALDRDAVMRRRADRSCLRARESGPCRALAGRRPGDRARRAARPASISTPRRASSAVNTGTKMSSRAAFLDAWGGLEPAVAEHYRDGLGCC